MSQDLNVCSSQLKVLKTSKRRKSSVPRNTSGCLSVSSSRRKISKSQSRAPVMSSETCDGTFTFTTAVLVLDCRLPERIIDSFELRREETLFVGPCCEKGNSVNASLTASRTYSQQSSDQVGGGWIFRPYFFDLGTVETFTLKELHDSIQQLRFVARAIFLNLRE